MTVDRGTSARALMNAGRYDLAERVLRDQIAGQPDRWDAHQLLAVCLSVRNALDDAFAEASEAVRLAPTASAAHSALGRVLEKSRDFAEAELEYREAVALDPEQAAGYAALAHVLLARGRPVDAVKTAAEGLRLDPHNESCLAMHAHGLLILNRIEEAHAELRSALADAPSRAYLHNSLGLALLHDGDAKRARIEFKEALRLDPSLQSARENLARSHEAFVWLSIYAFRAFSRWGTTRWTARLAVLSWLFLLGLVWQGAWGITAMLAMAAGSFDRQDAEDDTGLHTAGWMGGMLVMFLLIRLSGVAPQGPALRLWDWVISAEFVGGIVIFWIALPAFAGRGKAQFLAVAILAAAILISFASAERLAAAPDTGIALLFLLVIAVAATPIVFFFENMGRADVDREESPGGTLGSVSS